MNFEKTLNEWGFDISLDGYMPELLIAKFPDHCFYIDSLPISVNVDNAHKFEQIEKIMFSTMQDKILSVVTKLWLYNDVYCNSELLFELFHERKSNWKKKKIRKNLRIEIAQFPIPPQNTLAWKIDQRNQITTILELGKKDIIDVSLLFEQYKVIIVASWSCYFAFVGDLSKQKIVEKIVNVEGLYLRRYIGGKT